jgi:hypothetical protein
MAGLTGEDAVGVFFKQTGKPKEVASDDSVD